MIILAAARFGRRRKQQRRRKQESASSAYVCLVEETRRERFRTQWGSLSSSPVANEQTYASDDCRFPRETFQQ